MGSPGAVSGGESDKPGPGAQEDAGAEGAQGPAVCEVRRWFRPEGGKFRAECSGSRRHFLHVPAGVGVLGPG